MSEMVQALARIYPDDKGRPVWRAEMKLPVVVDVGRWAEWNGVVHDVSRVPDRVPVTVATGKPADLTLEGFLWRDAMWVDTAEPEEHELTGQPVYIGHYVYFDAMQFMEKKPEQPLECVREAIDKAKVMWLLHNPHI